MHILKLHQFQNIYTYPSDINRPLTLNYSYPWMENIFINQMHICIPGSSRHLSGYVQCFFFQIPQVGVVAKIHNIN